MKRCTALVQIGLYIISMVINSLRAASSPSHGVALSPPEGLWDVVLLCCPPGLAEITFSKVARSVLHMFTRPQTHADFCPELTDTWMKMKQSLAG